MSQIIAMEAIPIENKESYTPEEVARIVAAYAALVSLNKQIGGGRRIAMPDIEKYEETIKKVASVIPENVGKRLEKQPPSELEKSLLATTERSKD